MQNQNAAFFSKLRIESKESAICLFAVNIKTHTQKKKKQKSLSSFTFQKI